MKYVIILLSAILLDIMFPRFKIDKIYKVISVFFEGIINTYVNKKYNVVILVICIILSSFVLPFILLFYVNRLSLLVGFIFEIIICYYLISTREFIQIIFKKKQNTLQSNIIRIIINNIEKVFIPVLCISIGGPTLLLLLRALYFCTKSQCLRNTKALSYFINVSKILYFFPSYIFVLSALFAGAFLPFCNLSEAFQLYLKDKKSIYPYWLSRIFASCTAIAYAQLPINYTDKNGKIKKAMLGLSFVENNTATVKKIYYILFSTNITMLSVVILCRLILLWGVW